MDGNKKRGGAEMHERIREALAAYAHDVAWSGWMRYMFSKCEWQPDGTMLIPAKLVERWTRQMETPYAALPDAERESDRAQADAIDKTVSTALFGNYIEITTIQEAGVSRSYVAHYSRRQPKVVVFNGRRYVPEED